MSQLHVDLGHTTPRRDAFSAARLPRTAVAVLSVVAGIVAYVAAAVGISARLHLEGESAYWMSFGVLCLLLVLVGWARYLRLRGMGGWSERGIGLYVLAIGLGMFAFGLWRQLAVVAARRRCVEALAAAGDVHARIQVYQSHETLPTLSKGGAKDTMTCERLVHSESAR